VAYAAGAAIKRKKKKKEFSYMELGGMNL